MSRKPTALAGVTAVVGDFADPAELYKLDAYHDIDLLIHLAAVTGGCSEEDVSVQSIIF